MTLVTDILLDTLDIVLAILRLLGKVIAKGFHLLGEYPFAFLALAPLYAWGLISQVQMNWALGIIMTITGFAVIEHDVKMRAKEEDDE